MTRKELTKQIILMQKESLNLPDKDIVIAIKALIECMTASLVAGNKIEIRGFGCFTINMRSARIGRNPKTGETLRLDASKIVHFKAGKDLRERVNTSYLKNQKN